MSSATRCCICTSAITASPRWTCVSHANPCRMRSYPCPGTPVTHVSGLNTGTESNQRMPFKYNAHLGLVRDPSHGFDEAVGRLEMAALESALWQAVAFGVRHSTSASGPAGVCRTARLSLTEDSDPGIGSSLFVDLRCSLISEQDSQQRSDSTEPREPLTCPQALVECRTSKAGLARAHSQALPFRGGRRAGRNCVMRWRTKPKCALHLKGILWLLSCASKKVTRRRAAPAGSHAVSKPPRAPCKQMWKLPQPGAMVLTHVSL